MTPAASRPRLAGALRLRWVLPAGLGGALGWVGCGGAPAVPAAAMASSGAATSADPTVRPARIVPEAVVDERAYGLEPGGGVRFLVAGIRTVGLPGGRVLAAPDRLPQTPSQVVALPERMAGGFLFVVGQTLWHAPRWLAPARPIFAAQQSLGRVVVGLDRVYVRNAAGAHLGLDPRTGALLGAGPLPKAPFLGSMAAADGWRAAAVADLRGVVATFDAGTTWRSLPLPLDAKEVTAAGDSLFVSGTDAQRQPVTYEIRDGGQATRAPAPASRAVFADAAGLSLADPSLRAFGKRPLAAAVEDGWPLVDGTAVVARDGMLARVRLEDGALESLERDAFALRPARCRAVPMGGGTPGFVCGEPRGRTVVYRYEGNGPLREVRRFAEPRAVVASGNGSLVVTGPCGDGPAPAGAGERLYCLLPAGAPEREIAVRNATGGERVVALGGGRVVILSPPEGDLARARLTLLEGGRSPRTLPLAFEGASPEVARLLRGGTWLEGFEERRPGTLGGWIDGAGTVLGIEIDLDGTARAGALVRELGSPVVASRYGIGWSPSRRGYETTDGGMTWTAFDVPEPAHSARTSPARAVGPVGAAVGGWLRVGWGKDGGATETALPEPPRFPLRSGATVELDCEPVGPPPPAPTEAAPRPAPPRRLSLGALLTPMAPPAGPVELAPFFAVPAPPLGADETGFSLETSDPTDRSARSAPLARLYAWGPRDGEWDKRARFVVRWAPPFASSSEVRTTAVTPAPFPTLEAARRFFGQGAVTAVAWSATMSEDGQHALLVGRRSGAAESIVLALEAERPIVEVLRDGREPLGEVEAATRIAGRWVLAVGSGPTELPATVLLTLDGGIAREITRVARAGMEGRPPPVRLARRSDGRSVGLVVDGQPSPERAPARRWLVPVDLDSGAVQEPELLGYADLADRLPLGRCSGDELGWVLESTFIGSLRVHLPGQSLGLVQSAVARVRFGRSGVCLLAATGVLEGAAALPGRPRAARSDDGILAVVSGGRVKRALHCVARVE